MDNSVKDISAKDISVKDNSMKDNSAKDISVKDNSMDNSAKDISMKDNSVKDNSVKDNSVKDNSVRLLKVKFVSNGIPRVLQSDGKVLDNNSSEGKSSSRKRRKVKGGKMEVCRGEFGSREEGKDMRHPKDGDIRIPIDIDDVQTTDPITTSATEDSKQQHLKTQQNLQMHKGQINLCFSSDDRTANTVSEHRVELQLTTPETETKTSSSGGTPERGYNDASDFQTKTSSGRLNFFRRIKNSVKRKVKEHRVLLRRFVIVLFLVLYAAYFAYAMYFRFGDEGSLTLLAITVVAVAGLSISVVKKVCSNKFKNRLETTMQKISRHGSIVNWVVVILITVSVVIFIIVDVVVLSKNAYNLVSASGIFVYIILFFLFSRHPSKVQWRTILWGFALQLVFALFILRTDIGLKVFDWLGSRVSEFFSFSDEGAKFVFGETTYTNHFFAFKVMPTVIFFSTTVSVLYHLGIMQFLITKIAWVMQITMGTTAGESLTAAANIFIGQSEAPLLIGPLLPDMTASELHAVMTGGFATITGGIMAAYILLGVPANHLISASVMSAPAALAMSKLIFPETEESKTTVRHLKTALQRRSDDNVIGALSSGASSAIGIVANVVVNLIAFIATLYFLNAILSWFGARVGIEQLTFQLICSYVLWPFAFVMGVEFEDCGKVAQLIGIKTILNEFIAYKELGFYIDNRKLFDAHVSNNGSWYSFQDAVYLVNETVQGNSTVLAGGILTDRSIAIATYALCGFSNIGSMGIVLGGLASMAPERKTELSTGIITAMISGNVACFITACIAGLFYSPA